MSELSIKHVQFMTIKQLTGSAKITSAFEYFDLGGTPEGLNKIRQHEIKAHKISIEVCLNKLLT